MSPSIILITVIAISPSSGQTDNQGNPVFISELISEEKFDGFELTSNYYTIKDNISNKESSVYVADHPTTVDYLKFSRDLPSNFFIVHQGDHVVAGIVLLQRNAGSKTTYSYNIVNPANGESMEVPCTIFGEISEKRVEELEKLNVDISANRVSLNKGTIYVFNGIAFRIQPYDQVKAEVIEIAKRIVKDGKGNTALKDPVEYIKRETIGGDLDFNKVPEDNQSLLVYDGIAYNKKDFAIFLWGKKVSRLGIKSTKEATKLWEEIHKRALTKPEKKALINGFESEEVGK